MEKKLTQGRTNHFSNNLRFISVTGLHLWLTYSYMTPRLTNRSPFVDNRSTRPTTRVWLWI